MQNRKLPLQIRVFFAFIHCCPLYNIILVWSIPPILRLKVVGERNELFVQDGVGD